ADALAKGLALEHGCAPAVSEEPSPDAEAVNLGRKLIGTAGGFSCTACHPVGDQPAQMQLHFGVVNLKHSRERLRREHYLRWMLNPQRLQPSSPMPAYTDEDGRSALASILGGDGERQFEAIWECLR
ncbi:MAG TPA: hypothetical protein VFD71_13460, partial [Planctomycetota bacterium]|nr:hypothetical protein [Planctomycetota bacterium]